MTYKCEDKSAGDVSIGKGEWFKERNFDFRQGGPQAAAHGLYNSPLPLYSEETLANEPTNPGYVQVLSTLIDC